MERIVNLIAVKEIVDRSSEAILLCDEYGHILHANEACWSLFQYSYAELIGRAIETLMPENHRARHHDHVAHYLRNVTRL